MSYLLYALVSLVSLLPRTSFASSMIVNKIDYLETNGTGTYQIPGGLTETQVPIVLKSRFNPIRGSNLRVDDHQTIENFTIEMLSDIANGKGRIFNMAFGFDPRAVLEYYSEWTAYIHPGGGIYQGCFDGSSVQDQRTGEATNATFEFWLNRSASSMNCINKAAAAQLTLTLVSDNELRFDIRNAFGIKNATASGTIYISPTWALPWADTYLTRSVAWTAAEANDRCHASQDRWIQLKHEDCQNQSGVFSVDKGNCNATGSCYYKHSTSYFHCAVFNVSHCNKN